MKKLIPVALGAAMAVSAFAPNSASAAPPWCTTSVTEVALQSDGMLFFRGDGIKQAGGAGIYLCNIKDTTNLCESWLSILQAAQLSGRKINVSITSDTTCTTIPTGTDWVVYLKSI